jgi:hypothetical protein
MAKSGPHGKDKQRCGALVRHRHGFCRKWPVPGCRFHGGRSTGPLTDEGKARSLAAMREGRQRWLEETRAKKTAGEIKRFPGGRKSGSGWITRRMWEERAIETLQRFGAQQEASRPTPLEDLLLRAKARLAELRAQLRRYGWWMASNDPWNKKPERLAADLAARLERFQAGSRFWTEEE